MVGRNNLGVGFSSPLGGNQQPEMQEQERDGHLGILVSDKHQVFGLLLLQEDGTGDMDAGTGGGVNYSSITRVMHVSDSRIVFRFQHEEGVSEVTILGDHLLSINPQSQKAPPGYHLWVGKRIVLQVGKSGIKSIQVKPVDMKE